MQAIDGTQTRAIGTAGETARAKEKIGTGMASPKNGKVRTDRTAGAPVWKGKSNMKGCGMGSMCSVDEASGQRLVDAVRRMTAPAHNLKKNTLLHVD